MATVKKAKVIRGVYIRGVAYAEGTVGSVSNDGTKQSGDAFVVSHQEFNEMRVSNYLVPHVEPEVVAPAAVPAVETKYDDAAKKGK